MRDDEAPEFPLLFKRLVDAICQNEELTRPELAADLDLNPSSLSGAAYQGQIGFPLVESLCERARASDQEVADLELAWLKLRASRPRHEDLRRALSINRALMAEIANFSSWLTKRGMLEDYRGARRASPLVKRVRRRRRVDDS